MYSRRDPTATAAAKDEPETKSKLCKGEELVATAGPHQDRVKDARYKWAGGKAVFIGTFEK